MRKVIHVIRNIGDGGTERFLFNIIKNMHNDEFVHIIITYSPIENYHNIIKKFNIKTYIIDSPNTCGLKSNFNSLRKIFNEEKPTIVHSYTHYNSGIVMFAAWLEKVKIRITHSHRSESTRHENIPVKMYNFLSKLFISLFANVKIACSKEAAKSLFIGKYSIITNGIELDNYIFNKSKRELLQKKLNINSKDIVIGTVGRLDKNKNQAFLIDVFSKYHEHNMYSKLIIIGEGSEHQALEEKIKSLELDNDVFLLGSINNVNEYYNVFDVFTLTSYKEGLPFVLIEATANGLKSIVSDNVSMEANLAGNIIYISLSNPDEWVNTIKNIELKRKNYLEAIEDSGYSIKTTIKEIEKIYTK